MKAWLAQLAANVLLGLMQRAADALDKRNKKQLEEDLVEQILRESGRLQQQPPAKGK